MNKLTTNKMILYVLAIIILFYIPIFTIIEKGSALKKGTEYLFRVETFDPYDAFRGNYLNITFKENTVKGKKAGLSEDYKTSECYAIIEKDSNGFAYFKDISLQKPEKDLNYYKTTARYRQYNDEYIIETPTRYYMNENNSEIAEKVYRDNIDSTYVKVRVKDGNMVIIGVYVDDILIDSIED